MHRNDWRNRFKEIRTPLDYNCCRDFWMMALQDEGALRACLSVALCFRFRAKLWGVSFPPPPPSVPPGLLPPGGGGSGAGRGGAEAREELGCEGQPCGSSSPPRPACPRPAPSGPAPPSQFLSLGGCVASSRRVIGPLRPLARRGPTRGNSLSANAAKKREMVVGLGAGWGAAAEGVAG